MDVGGWLRSLGLGQYEALFRASEIDADILPELTEIDLEKLGVPLGHRKRLLRAIVSDRESAMGNDRPRQRCRSADLRFAVRGRTKAETAGMLAVARRHPLSQRRRFAVAEAGER